MSRREDIDNAIWTDPDFEALSADATLLYLWSWTNPRCGMAGIYKVSVRAMTESKVALEQIPVVLVELTAARFAYYEEQVLWIRTRVKHLRSRSPQMARSIVADLRKLTATHPLVAKFMDEYRSDVWLRDDLEGAYREGIGNLSKKPIGKGDSHTLSVGSLEPTGTGTGTSGTGVDGGSGGKVKLPADFPDELRPHLAAIYRVLRDLAARHDAKAVSPLSLANVLQPRSRKPMVKAAHDFAAWADGQTRRQKDVVSGYRNWLERTDDLARIERIENVTPIAAAPSAPREPNKYDQAAARRTEQTLNREAS